MEQHNELVITQKHFSIVLLIDYLWENHSGVVHVPHLEVFGADKKRKICFFFARHV